MNAAIAIGSAILPTLIAAIQEGLDNGLSEEEATRRALERMRSTTLPSPLAAETRDAFAAARAALPSPDPDLALVSLRELRAAVRETHKVAMREDRVVLVALQQTGG